MAPFVTSGPGSGDVRQIQQALNRAGRSVLARLVEDGINGPKTHARVLEFQRSRALVPDGIVGPKTRAALGMSGVPAGFGFVSAPSGAPINSGNVASLVVRGTKTAFLQWKRQAMFQGIVINSVIAIGPPGCLTGPNLGPLILSFVTALQNDERAIALAASQGIGTNFALWQAGVTVPGLPWYPTFAAFPGPFAPPTPNLPTGILALPSSGLLGIVVSTKLQSAMEQAAPAGVRASAGSAFRDIALQVASFFQTSLATTIVQNVLGQGPVPSFAPPAIPVGSVIGGSTIPLPGQLV